MSDRPFGFYAHPEGIIYVGQYQKRILTFDYVGSGRSDLEAYDAKRYGSLDGYAQDVLDVIHALDPLGDHDERTFRPATAPDVASSSWEPGRPCPRSDISASRSCWVAGGWCGSTACRAGFASTTSAGTSSGE